MNPAAVATPAPRRAAHRLRAVAAVPVIVFFTLLFGLPALVLALLDRSGRLAMAAARGWSRSLLWTCGITVTVEGAPAEGPAVYTANHGSALDIPMIFGHLPVDFRIVHKRSLQRVPVVGWFLMLAGHVGIDRTRPFRARRSLDRAAALLRAGTSIVTFPEGTRGRDAQVRRFKRGPIHLALEAGVPIVPVSLRGVKETVPHGILTLRPGAVRLVLHPAVPTAGVTDEAELAERVRAAVARGCDEPPA